MTEETSLIKRIFMRMKRFLTIVQILLVVIIIIFGYKIVQTYMEDKQERANYEKLQQNFKC